MAGTPRGNFFLGIILPTLLAIVISVVSIYAVIIPSFQDSFLQSKKEMIQELTNVAWNILVFYENQEKLGHFTKEQAQNQAISEIRELRYGEENKDYFWVTDIQPRMIMHPYSPELDGKDLSEFHDAEGTAIFVKMQEITALNDSGFLNYTWHSKYEEHSPVAKLSYVKKFEPWKWIVGTGAFLDDVERKTAMISKHMLLLVFATVILFSLLLLYVARQSFEIEKQRLEAEKNLKLSREKYKALAESATDPMVMIYDNKLIYANKSMCSMLNYTQEEIQALNPIQLFFDNSAQIIESMPFLDAASPHSSDIEDQKRTLKSKNGTSITVKLSFSPMKMGDHTALVMAAKNIPSSEITADELDSKESRYQSLMDKLKLGTFRVDHGKSLPLLQASLTTRKLLAINEKIEIDSLSLLNFCMIAKEKKELLAQLQDAGIITKMSLQLKKDRTGESGVFSISMVGVEGSDGEIEYYDGILEEITEQKKAEQDRENLIVELQTSLLFLNQPIKYSLKNFVSCDLDTSIAEATQIMASASLSSILVTGKSEEMIGIITDMVLRERVLAEKLPYDTPVYKVMSSPLIYIDDSALIFEAVLLMQEKGIKHLVVKDSAGITKSVISNEELLHVHRYSTAFMLSEIREAHSLEEIFATRIRIPRIVKSLADSGAHARNITRIITTISDTVLEKIIEFAIEDLGDPPTPFAFISLGSEGRGEQTLVTDQDNAIIYLDTEDEDVSFYFNSLGLKICTWLDMAGYAFCQGEIMAMNPKWCQPISIWKEYFSQWIKKGSPKDLLEVSIFFDFRCVYGDPLFTDELRQHIAKLVDSRAVFLQHLAQTSLAFMPPVDFFGNIQPTSADQQSNGFDIKKVIACIVGFARVYAVERAIVNTNTIKRIEELLKKGKINSATHAEMLEAYNYLMKLRFRHQVKMIDTGKDPDNHIDLDALSHMDKTMLKKTFSQVSSIKKRLSYDFSGVA